MGLLKKNPDLITDKARALNAEIAALEAESKKLDSQLTRSAEPKFRSTATPAGEASSRPAEKTPPPPPPKTGEPVFEKVGGNRLAVMPSLIENSSLAVYEALICKVPFIASDSGGTPELVDPADHPYVLCAAHPVPLADRLALALERGG